MKKNPRVAGILMTVVGFGMAGFLWDHAVTLAKVGADHVRGVDGVLLGVTFGVIGLLVLFGGEKLTAQVQGFRERRKNWKDFLFFAVILLPGFLARLYLQSILQEYGYTF